MVGFVFAAYSSQHGPFTEYTEVVSSSEYRFLRSAVHIFVSGLAVYDMWTLAATCLVLWSGGFISQTQEL